MKKLITKLQRGAALLAALAMMAGMAAIPAFADETSPEPSEILLPGQHALGLIPEAPTGVQLPAVGNPLLLPDLYDNSSLYPPPGDQGAQGSCTAWAVGYAYKSYQENLERGWGVGTSATQFSPSYIYNQINFGVDGGSYISDAMELIIDQGVCTLEDMPYNQYDYTTQPDDPQRDAAAQYKALSYGAVAMATDTIKLQIQETGGVVLGIPVYRDFDNINEDNEVYDVLDNYYRGWHAICLVGWDNSKEAFKFVNSWGPSWGLGGFGYISYDLVTDSSTNIYGYAMTDIIDVISPEYTIEYSVLNSWGDNQNVQITITNTGTETIRNWALKYDDTYGTITNLWNGVLHGDDIVKNAMYNSDIAPGATVTLGYILTNATGGVPVITLCTFRAAKTDGYTVDVSVLNDWGSGFTGAITITNTTDTPIMAWILGFDAVNFTVSDTGQFVILENSGNYYKITGTYNGNIPIPANTSIVMQFNGTKTSTPELSNVLLTEMVF